ncbi:hypothetical protein LTR85_010705 [Meristemomyces frigidus]|nr:hypothetical protein LTR85_010705 [Meristemomyces frigidus]
MQITLAMLGLAAVVMAVPAPAPTPAAELEDRQLGGGAAGTAGDGCGTIGGGVDSTAASGCIGGAYKNDGGSLCYPFVTKRQQLGGGAAGTAGPASGTLGGAISKSGFEGCGGGGFESEGYTFCFPNPTPAPKLKERQQLSGGAAGTAGPASGTLGGAISASGFEGCGGGAFENEGATFCFPNPTPAPKLKERQQLGGGGAGTAGPLSGTLGGAISASGFEGCAGGAFESDGATFCFPNPTPAPRLMERQQVGGGGAGTAGPLAGTAGVAFKAVLVLDIKRDTDIELDLLKLGIKDQLILNINIEDNSFRKLDLKD